MEGEEEEAASDLGVDWPKGAAAGWAGLKLIPAGVDGAGIGVAS